MNAIVHRIDVQDPAKLSNFLDLPRGHVSIVSLGGQPVLTHITDAEVIEYLLNHPEIAAATPLGAGIEADFGGKQITLQTGGTPFHKMGRNAVQNFFRAEHQRAVTIGREAMKLAAFELYEQGGVPFEVLQRHIAEAMNAIFYKNTFNDFLGYLRDMQESVLMVVPAYQARDIRSKYGDTAVPDQLGFAEVRYAELVGILRDRARIAYNFAKERDLTKGTLWEVFEQMHSNSIDGIISAVFDLANALSDTASSVTNSITFILGQTPDMQLEIRKAIEVGDKNTVSAAAMLAHMLYSPVAATPRFLLQDLDVSGYVVPVNTMIMLNLVRGVRDTLPEEFNIGARLDLPYMDLFNHVRQNYKDALHWTRLTYGGEGSPKECLGYPLAFALSTTWINEVVPQYVVPSFDMSEVSIWTQVMNRVKTGPIKFQPIIPGLA